MDKEKIVFKDLEKMVNENHIKVKGKKRHSVKKERKMIDKICYFTAALLGCVCAIGLFVAFAAGFSLLSEGSTVDYRIGTICADGHSIMTTDGNVWDQAQAFPPKSEVKVWFDNKGTEETTDDMILKIEK